jgi:hypothetical protein
MGEMKMHTKSWLENLKGRNKLEALDNIRMDLKVIG